MTPALQHVLTVNSYLSKSIIYVSAAVHPVSTAVSHLKIALLTHVLQGTTSSTTRAYLNAPQDTIGMRRLANAFPVQMAARTALDLQYRTVLSVAHWSMDLNCT